MGETKEEKIEAIRKSLCISNINHTFENFNALPGTENSLVKFRQAAEDNNKTPFLLCLGGVGSGKTHLCEALVIALYRQKIYTSVLVWSEFVRELKRKMRQPPNSGEESYDDLFEKVKKRKCLVIDDIGLGTQGSEWEWGELEDIISYRYRGRLVTILTSNLDGKSFPERIISRFRDPEIGCVVINKGADYRRRKA